MFELKQQWHFYKRTTKRILDKADQWFNNLPSLLPAKRLASINNMMDNLLVNAIEITNGIIKLSPEQAETE